MIVSERERFARLELLTRALDGLFRIPGTRIRFGLDGIVGLVPGVGDALTSVASFALLVAGVRYGVPKIVVLRMGLNLALDYVVGSIPLLGDLFDVAWKSNEKNLALLQANAGLRQGGAGDYVFVFGILAALVALLVASAAFALWLLATLWHAAVG